MRYTYLNKEKCRTKECGTCKYLSIHREIIHSFYSDNLSIQLDDNGICTKLYDSPQKSIHDSCLYYKLADDIAVELLKIDAKEQKAALERQKKENEKIEKQRRLENERHESELYFIKSAQEKKIKEELRLEKEQKYKEWYNSLTSEQQKEEYEKLQKSAKIEAKQAKKIMVICSVILAAIVTLFSVVKLFKHVKFKNSPDGRISEWIEKNGNSNSYTLNYPVDGYSIQYKLEYHSKQQEISGASYTYMASVYLQPTTSREYEKCYGSILFNFGEFEKAYFQGEVIYNDCTIYPYFNCTLNDCPEITQFAVGYHTEGANKHRDLTEATEDSWKAIKVAVILTNSTFKQIDSSFKLW